MLRIGNYTINSDINTIVEKLIEEGLLKGKHRDSGQYVTNSTMKIVLRVL